MNENCKFEYTNILFTSLLMCLFSIHNAQPVQLQFTADTPYLFSEDISNRLAKDTYIEKYSEAAWGFANIGDYENDLKV